MPEDEDAAGEMVARALRSDQQAFAWLYENTRDFVRCRARERAGRDWEDVAQEAYAYAFSHLDVFATRFRKSFHKFLSLAVRSAAARHRNRRRACLRSRHVAWDDGVEKAGDDPEPWDEAARREERGRFEAAVEALDPADRELFEAYYRRGEGYRALMKRHKVSDRALAQRLAAVRAALAGGVS